MPTSKLVPWTVHALFAMAAVTSLAMGDDPVAVVYDQQQLRQHFLESLATGYLKAFPVLKSRRVASQQNKSEKFQVYCYILPNEKLWDKNGML